MLARKEGVKYIKKTSSGTVTTAGTPGLLYGVNLQLTAAASSVQILDGGASGTEVAFIALDGTSAGNANSTRLVEFHEPILCITDIYCVLAGSGAAANVFYLPLA